MKAQLKKVYGKAKQWVDDNKVEIAMAGAYVMGAIVTAVVFEQVDKQKTQKALKDYESEVKVLGKKAHSDGRYYMTGSGETIDSLVEDFRNHGGFEENEQVVGAVIYTKNK